MIRVSVVCDYGLNDPHTKCVGFAAGSVGGMEH